MVYQKNTRYIMREINQILITLITDIIGDESSENSNKLKRIKNIWHYIDLPVNFRLTELQLSLFNYDDINIYDTQVQNELLKDIIVEMKDKYTNTIYYSQNINYTPCKEYKDNEAEKLINQYKSDFNDKNSTIIKNLENLITDIKDKSQQLIEINNIYVLNIYEIMKREIIKSNK